MGKAGIVGNATRGLALAAVILVLGGVVGSQAAPRYPRIVNLYGAGLSWANQEAGLAYWSKLGLIIGGGSDWHYDYGAKDRTAASELAASRARLVQKASPDLIILPYVDMIEGPDNPALPPAFWLKGSDGERVSTWPGFWRVDTGRGDVLALTEQAIERLLHSDQGWHGVFLDCWSPDGVVVPALRARQRESLIMTNAGNLPAVVSPLVNGALSEDELNRAAAGELDIRELMDRYHRWMRDSAKPALTSISCHPRTVDADPWRWSAASQTERAALIEKGREGDPAMMRFGLCFTLMDDGYFAYDAGTQARGQWWWYPEFEAPIGSPLGPATEAGDAVWKREFSLASVWVNGSDYDEPIRFDAPMRDFSTGRVARDFVIPRVDGRIFVPASLPVGAADNGIASDAALFVRSGVAAVKTETSRDGSSRWQLPGGMELFFSQSGLLDRLNWKGKRVLSGGHPVIVLPQWREIAPAAREVANTLSPNASLGLPPNLSTAAGNAAPLVWSGTVGWSDAAKADGDFLRDDYRIAAQTHPDGSAQLRISDDFTVLRDFSPAMWRQYVFLPVSGMDPHTIHTLQNERYPGALLLGRSLWRGLSMASEKRTRQYSD